VEEALPKLGKEQLNNENPGIVLLATPIAGAADYDHTILQDKVSNCIATNKWWKLKQKCKTI
jgi:hypothetical protein